MPNRFSLAHLASFSIEGADAHDFAQAQFTVDVNTLSGERWAPLACCDPKGRVIAFMIARSAEDRIELILPASQAEDVGKTLAMFTIGRKVTISEPGPVAGSFHPDAATAVLGPDPGRGLTAGIEATADAAAQRRWQRLDLCLALPWLEPASARQHLPQWLGLEALGGLVHDKGCYPGQEVIARLHFSGKVKYRTTGLILDSGLEVPAHARLADEQGRRVGHWLYGFGDSDAGAGLAVLDNRIADGGQVWIRVGENTCPAKVTAAETLC